MKKVVRLTESDLTRIVKRVIREDQQSAMMAQKASSCFDERKYPVISKYMKAWGLTIQSLLEIAVTIGSAGTMAMFGVTNVPMVTSDAAKAIKKAYNQPNSPLSKEIKTFLKCVGVM